MRRRTQKQIELGKRDLKDRINNEGNKDREKIWPGKNKKRKYPCGSYCQLNAALLESKAYYELKGEAAHRCLIRFYQKIRRAKITNAKRRKYIETNLKEIIFTYSEAKEFGGISEATFNRVIKQLLDLGFIDIVEPGNWHLRIPTMYGISQRWNNYGTAMYIKPKFPKSLPDKW